MRRIIEPSIAPPFGAYSHAVEIPPGARIVLLAGQVGCHKDGTVPPEAEQQALLVFKNLKRVLEASQMSVRDIVKLNIFAVSADDLPALRAARDQFLDGSAPAMSLVIVAGLGRPEWKFEIDGVAARVD